MQEDDRVPENSLPAEESSHLPMISTILGKILTCVSSDMTVSSSCIRFVRAKTPWRMSWSGR